MLGIYSFYNILVFFSFLSIDTNDCNNTSLDNGYTCGICMASNIYYQLNHHI